MSYRIKIWRILNRIHVNLATKIGRRFAKAVTGLRQHLGTLFIVRKSVKIRFCPSKIQKSNSHSQHYHSNIRIRIGQKKPLTADGDHHCSTYTGKDG